MSPITDDCCQGCYDRKNDDYLIDSIDGFSGAYEVVEFNDNGNYNWKDEIDNQ